MTSAGRVSGLKKLCFIQKGASLGIERSVL